MKLSQPGTPRVLLFAFGLVLAAGALWVLLAEVPRMSAFDGHSRSGAEWSANTAMVRGDLWRDYALALTGCDDSGGLPAACCAEPDAGAEEAAQRAVRNAPHDSLAWAVLACTVASRDSERALVVPLLRLSFLTGRNMPDAMTMRVATALGTGLHGWPVDEVLSHDLAVMAEDPVLLPPLAGIYRRASLGARTTIEKYVPEQTVEVWRAELHPETPATGD